MPKIVFEKVEVKIEKNIPIPIKCYSRYPFSEMEIGDSFLVHSALIKSIRTDAYMAGKRLSKKFSTRRVSDGVRIWRIK